MTAERAGLEVAVRELSAQLAKRMENPMPKSESNLRAVEWYRATSALARVAAHATTAGYVSKHTNDLLVHHGLRLDIRLRDGMPLEVRLHRVSSDAEAA